MVLDELGDLLRIVAASLVWVLSLSSLAVAGDIDFSGPAPDVEISRASEFVRRSFGEDVFESSVVLASSGLINSQGDITGYFVCFHFCPPSAFGSYASLCVQRHLDEEFRSITGGEMPACIERPSSCGVRIGDTEALHVARENGLKSELQSSFVSLRWSEEHEVFVWEVGERRLEDVSDTAYLADSRVFVISAGSGEVLEVRAD